MPIIKATIEGREYSFAPLKLREMRGLQGAKVPADVLDRIDFWTPLIQSSMSRAGNDMPDLDDMDVDIAGYVFGGLLNGILKASGLELAPVGEAQPVATTGTTSTVSL